MRGCIPLEIHLVTRKEDPSPPKLVWRISERAPMGEWVDASRVDEAPTSPLPEVSFGGWVISSYDLLQGSDASEVEDTIPGELFDELFAPSKKDAEES